MTHSLSKRKKYDQCEAKVKGSDLLMVIKMAFNRLLRVELSAQGEKEDLSERGIRTLKSLITENTKTSS